MDTPNYPIKLLKQYILENDRDGDFWDESGFASIAEILENHFKAKDWNELRTAVKSWPGELLYFLIN
jgi:hypothetical protein